MRYKCNQKRKIIIHQIYRFGLWLVLPLFVLFSYLSALLARVISKPNNNRRLVWGSAPIINYSYWSRAMRDAGYSSDTFTTDYYSSINKRDDWDRILSENYCGVPYLLKPFVAFIHSLFSYDIFIISFDGFFLGSTPLAYFQASILKLAGKKIIVIPYGGDSYIYRRIRSIGTLHGLLMSYPMAARNQRKISRDVDYWCANADVLIHGFMAVDGFGRWDIHVPSPLSIDLNSWLPSIKTNNTDGINGTVVVTHAPNHRGFKGTEFILEAVCALQNEGLKIELKLLERIQNTEVKRILREDTDILVEQLIVTGHGINGLEGLASGLPVISNLEDDSYVMPIRRWSYFNECPLVSASPETLVDVLRKLVTRPELRQQLGKASRAYAEKYHGLDSAQYLFTSVIDYAYGRRDSLINLYHPLLGEYPNRSPKIEHPLVNNRIVD
jgi:hypothetical protein